VCVTESQDFATLCLNPVVLKNVLVALNNVRGDNWNFSSPDQATEFQALRYAAYRQFMWWIFGRSGAKNRRVIPACVVHCIRQRFPKTDGDEYEGYHSAQSDSD